MTLRVPTDPPANGFVAWARKAANAVNQLITGKQDLSDNLTSLSGLDLTGHSGDSVVVTAGEDGFELSAVSGGSGISDGDYGDVTASLSGTVLTVDNDAITYAKMQNVSATDKLLGRSTAGAGDVEEIPCTAAGRALLDDANAAAQLVTLGAAASSHTHAQSDITLATDLAALEALSGTNTIYYRSAANTWTAVTIGGGLSFSGGTLNRAAFRGALVKKSADQTGANYTTQTAVTWDSETGGYDTDTIHDNVTNPSRLTTPAGVTKVRLAFQLRISGHTADNWLFAAIAKNGSTEFLGAAGLITEAGLTTGRLDGQTAVITVTGGTDYFELLFQVEADTTINIEEESSWFSMEIIE